MKIARTLRSQTNLRKALLIGYDHTDIGLIGAFSALDNMLQRKIIDPKKTIIAYEVIPPDFLTKNAVKKAHSVVTGFPTPASIFIEIKALNMSQDNDRIPHVIEIIKYAYLLKIAHKHDIKILQLDDPDLDAQISQQRIESSNEMDVIKVAARQRQGHMINRILNHCFYEASEARNIVTLSGFGHPPEIAEGLRFFDPKIEILPISYFSELLLMFSGRSPDEHMAFLKEHRDQYYAASNHVSPEFLKKYRKLERASYCPIEDETLETFPKIHENLIQEIERLFENNPSPSFDVNKSGKERDYSEPTMYL